MNEKELKSWERKDRVLLAGLWLSMIFWAIALSGALFCACDEPQQVQEPDPHGGGLLLDVPPGGGG